jgi:glycosyltransferase involved in cell wall biosynthesis
MAISDWVALPYSRTFTSQSGVLNVAAWYRRPVLLSDTPTFRETAEQCDIGCLVEPDNMDAIGEGIGRIVERVEARHIHQFDEYLSRFGWEENIDRTVRVYRDLINAPSRR